jgi:hypothetical protein
MLQHFVALSKRRLGAPFAVLLFDFFVGGLLAAPFAEF